MNKPPDLKPGEENGRDKSREKTMERPAMKKAIVVMNRARWAWTFMIRCFSSIVQKPPSRRSGIALPADSGATGRRTLSLSLFPHLDSLKWLSGSPPTNMLTNRGKTACLEENLEHGLPVQIEVCAARRVRNGGIRTHGSRIRNPEPYPCSATGPNHGRTTVSKVSIVPLTDLRKTSRPPDTYCLDRGLLTPLLVPV
jgi:hypothetical protein